MAVLAARAAVGPAGPSPVPRGSAGPRVLGCAGAADGSRSPANLRRRSGSSPDKHIDFKIKRVPTAAAARLEQTEMWH